MNPENLPEFYANVIDSVGDGVIVLDSQGMITLMNPVAEELAGVSRRISKGQAFATLFRTDPDLVEMVQKSSASGMSISDYENITLKRGGRSVPLSVTASPLLMADGARAGTIILLRDLTNIRDLEEAVRKGDRLSTLGTLAAGLAHEIKNPLGGIRGAAQLLEMEITEDDELRECTRVILKEVQRVNRIVEELLDLSSPRSLTLTAVNLHKILAHVVFLQQQAVEGRAITFQRHLDPSIPPIMADEGRLTQLFLNLIKNAVEAVEDSGIVEISSRIVSDYSMTQKGERRSRMIAIEVSDNGAGIPDEEMAQLFTPFYTTKERGTGLGLAICQKIVAEHRGMIRGDTEVGKGTVFTILLPLVQ
ncbi:MAG: PAS domain S-box protein [Geobacter sp.]|nr:PAS domain S-box protein [Geobacter sp.]